jgi:EmrB/QacA subfamily drug resistance transporter
MSTGINSTRTAIRSSERYRWYALGVIMLGTFMGPLDASIANVAMPQIARALGRRVDEAEWVLLAYMLITASTLVLFGRLGDMFGQKRIYLAGFAVFGAGSLACALSPSLEVLIAFRALQAIGAAMLVSCTQALIVESFPPHERGRAIGFNGAAVAAALSTGPIVGGAIVTFADWRWLFLINIPIALVALPLAALVLKPGTRKDEGFDLVGAGLSIAGLFCLSLALSRSHAWGWGSARVIGLFVAAAAILIVFVRVERRAAHPALDLSLFSSRLFSMSTIAAFVYFTAQSGVVFIVPLSAQLALGASPLAAGFLLIPLTVLNVVLAPLAGSLSDRVPVRYISTAGALTVAVGAFVLSRLPAHPTTQQILESIVIAGIGTAVFTQPNNSAIMGSAPSHRRGVAAATLATARTTGQLLGVATAGAVYFARAAGLGPRAHTYAPATAYFGIVAVAMVLVALISWIRE